LGNRHAYHDQSQSIRFLIYEECSQESNSSAQSKPGHPSEVAEKALAREESRSPFKEQHGLFVLDVRQPTEIFRRINGPGKEVSRGMAYRLEKFAYGS